MEIPPLSSLDTHFADFIIRIEGNNCKELWLAAALVSNVSCRGSVCLVLSQFAGKDVAIFKPDEESMKVPPANLWQELLSVCDTVGQPGDYAPLILDESGRLYLHRSWDAERKVAEGILSRCGLLHGASAIIPEGLHKYFPLVADDGDLQKVAAHMALTRQFTIITGGPGTGKTSTIARILALLIEQGGNQRPRIMLSAPTGKAAMRLKQSLMHAGGKLPIPDAVRSAMPQEVTTIHRMLGALPGRSNYRYDRDHPLPCDVLVVDEASMIDLQLMARLLEALNSDSRVVLLGDRDQLASVEAGAVMADICGGVGSNAALQASRPAVVSLTKSYRFSNESGVGRLSCLINAGDGVGALTLLKSGHYQDIRWRPLPPPGSFAESLMETAAKGFTDFAHATEPHNMLEALDHFRVIAPHREGRHGVATLNRLIESALSLPRSAGLLKGLPTPVIVTTNSYEMELFNGDTGITMEGYPDTGSAAYFLSQETGGVRRISMLRLPQHETAFALTVHRSQGSEFDNVLLVLPDQLSELLSRELLYTAITRARKGVEIWGDEEVFCQAVERRTERNSGLLDRLWKAGAE